MSTSGLPAILGGAPFRPQGPPSWPVPDEAVRAALESALRDGSWGRYDGGHVARLEQRLAEWTGCDHVLTCASGTFAVEVALRALGVGPGDEVVLSAYDYPGNFLCVHAVGAHPVLVDVATDNWNLNVEALFEALGPTTRALIVSHLHGGLVGMAEVMRLCQERGVAVIEDAAQVPGGRVQGRLAGTWGDVGIFSFGGSKLLSAGRGGTLLTNRADVHQRARLVLGRGNNLLAPLSELQAVVLQPQLDALESRHGRRATAVATLSRLFEVIPGLRLFRNAIEGSPAYYKVGFQYSEETFGLPRARLVAAMRAEGIALDEGFRALHVGRATSRWRAAGSLGEAEKAHRGCLVLHHPILLERDEDLAQIAQALVRIRENRGS
jgi:dTDP-4-amino-4,6-dideoxygalactose transaminase